MNSKPGLMPNWDGMPGRFLCFAFLFYYCFCVPLNLTISWWDDLLEEKRIVSNNGFTLLLIKGCLVQNAETGFVMRRADLPKERKTLVFIAVYWRLLSPKCCWIRDKVRWLARDKEKTGLDNGVQNASKESLELGGKPNKRCSVI